MKKFKISKIFKKGKKKKKKKKRKFSKKALGLGAMGSYFLGCFKKKKKITNQNFQFHEKIQDFQIKKKKKKSSLNSSSGTESYDPLPHSPVMQYQVNYPPPAFFEA